jgi:hypothetical protein
VNCFSPELHTKIKALGYGSTAAGIEQMHTRLLHYRMPSVEMAAGNKAQETLGNAILLWQVHLHRVERLMTTCGNALSNDDVHGFATLTRAIVESTGVVGAVLSSLLRWSVSRTTVEQVAKDMQRALVGMKGGPVESKNVMSWIEKADELIEKTVPEEQLPNQLMSMYDALSEICHPNLLSNLNSLKNVSSDGKIEIAHGAKIDSDQMMLLGTLAVVSRLFMDFSHSFQNLLMRGLPTNSLMS